MSECETRSHFRQANSSSEYEIGFPENEIGFPRITYDLNFQRQNPNRSSSVSSCKYPLKKP